MNIVDEFGQPVDVAIGDYVEIMSAELVSLIGQRGQVTEIRIDKYGYVQEFYVYLDKTPHRALMRGVEAWRVKKVARDA